METLCYSEILDKLSREWLDTELGHTISNSASEALWSVAEKFFHHLHRAKLNEMIYTPIPKFVSIRRRMFDTMVPPVELEIVYEHKESNELVKVKTDHTPVSKYPSTEYRKLYEVATVKVNTILSN